MTTKPKIELKNIKHTAWASEETFCYQAALYVNGERWGMVSNDGHGGCDNFYGENGRGYSDIATLNALIAETYPPYVYTFGDIEKPIKRDLEGVCTDLLEQWLRDKDFARNMRSKVLFTKPDAQGIWQVAVKKPQTLASMLTAMKAKYPQYTYLADLPIDEAKEIYFSFS